MGIITIPNRPANTDARHIADLLANFDAITAQTNGNIDDTNLKSPMAGYKRLILGQQISINGTTNSGDNYPNGANGAVELTGNAPTNCGPFLWAADSLNEWVINNKTSKGILRVTGMVGGTAPTGTVTIGFYPVTVSGTNCVYTLGTVVSGSTVAFSSMSSGTLVSGVSTGFTLPTSGVYAVGLNTGAQGASTVLMLYASLFMFGA